MKRSKNRLVRIILLCILAVILAVMIGLLIYLESEKPSDIPEPTIEVPTAIETAGQTQILTEPVPSETEYVPEAGGNVITTPYITLFFPDELSENLSVETVEDPVYTVKFAALIGGQTYPLFNLCFGGHEGDAIGVVYKENGDSISVKAVMHELNIPADMDTGDAQMIHAMQESVVHIARQLPKAEGSGALEPEAEDIIVETPFCNLSIPGKWAEFIQIEIHETNGYTVCFNGAIDSHKVFPLFDVILDGEGDEFIGTLVLDGGMEIAVCMNTYELTPDSNWTEKETDMAYALLELVNDALDGLKSLENFIAAEQ